MSDSRSLSEELGIELDDIVWQDLSLCSGQKTNMFFDEYESDEQIAKLVDDMCMSCPVMTQCLQHGISNGETGVWGGIYLVSGKPDNNRNAHKTEDIWQQIREKINADPL